MKEQLVVAKETEIQNIRTENEQLHVTMKEKEEQIKEKDKVINFKISEIEIIRKKARI